MSRSFPTSEIAILEQDSNIDIFRMLEQKQSTVYNRMDRNGNIIAEFPDELSVQYLFYNMLLLQAIKVRFKNLDVYKAWLKFVTDNTIYYSDLSNPSKVSYITRDGQYVLSFFIQLNERGTEEEEVLLISKVNSNGKQQIDRGGLDNWRRNPILRNTNDHRTNTK